MFVSALMMTMLAIIFLSFYFSKTEYSIAFRELDSADAAAITSYLDSSKISYKLTDGADGTIIAVPSTDATKVKIDIESQGLIQNGAIGYGIFRDNISSFGMTDNEFNVLGKDALAGEIQQLINGMNGVSGSKVLVTIPEESVFIDPDNKEEAQASVILKLKPGYRIDQEKIDSIYNLVSKSVPNLPIANISLSGPDGELPASTQGGNDNSATIATQQFQIEKQFNDSIESKVKSFLNPLFNSDKIVVNVVSALNFDKKQSHVQSVKPVVDTKGIEISLQEIQESYSGESAPSGGVIGTGPTEVPNYPAESSTGKTESEKISRTINYEVDRITDDISSSPYFVKDLTINVGIEPPNKNDPNTLTQETKDAVKNILVNIVSASLANNPVPFTPEEMQNKVVILAKAFDGNAVETTAGTFNNYLLYGLGGVVLALVAGGAFLAIRSRRRKNEIIEEELPEYPVRLEIPSIDMDPAKNESQVRKQLESLAKKRPEEFVNLLRTWLVDE